MKTQHSSLSTRAIKSFAIFSTVASICGFASGATYTFTSNAVMAFQPAADDTLVLSTSTQPLLRVAVPLTPDAAYVSFIYGSVPPLSEFFGNVLEGTQSQGAPGFSIYPNGDMAGFGQPGFSIDPLAHRITFDLAQVRTLAPFRFGFTTDLVNFGLSASSPGAFITVSDFHVIPSPEPTTVGLLLCGSVFCFGRRTLREHDRNA